MRQAYLVTVYNRASGVKVDQKSFPYGTWMEIAYWLDETGLNDPRFRVGIHFSD